MRRLPWVDRLLLASLLPVCVWLAVRFAGGRDAAGAPVPTTQQLERVILVYKTHFDVGYTHPVREVVDSWRTRMIGRALKVADEYEDMPAGRRFVWTVPGWPMRQILWEGQTPEIRGKTEKALRSGSLVLHALPFSTHTETAEIEDLVRGLLFSSQIARSHGLPLPRGAKLTDVPSHTWIVPTLLRNAGVDFLHIGCNEASRPAGVPMLFWWEGPDGSRLLTLYTDQYGTRAEPPKDWPYPVWLRIHMTYDNEGPPSPETIRNDLAFYARRYPGAKVEVGQLQDFGDALLAGDPEIPVVRGDMPDRWVHGPASSPRAWETAAAGRAEVAAAEALATLNEAWGVASSDPSTEIAKAYEQSLLLSEHTWGAADQQHFRFQYVKEPGDPYMTTAEVDPEAKRTMESSWAEHTAYAEHVHQIGRKALRKQLDALAAKVGVEGKRVVVFNPLPWPRTGLVEVEGAWGVGNRVKDADGLEFAAAVDGASLKFVARDVPAMGYRTYPIAVRPSAQQPAPDCSVDEAAYRIECPFYAVSFDPARGRIRSMVDKRTGNELVDDSGPQGFQHFYERFSKQETSRCKSGMLRLRAWGTPHADMLCRDWIPDERQQAYVALTPSDMKFEARASPLGVSATLFRAAGPTLPHGVRWTVTLYRDLPQADLTVDITDKQETGWPEALWVSLPFRIANPRFRVGRVGSIIDPATDIVEDTNHRFYWSNFGVAISDAEGDGAGVGVCPLDTPGISLGEPGLMRFDDYTPDESRVFVNLYNNVWHTNFRTWYGEDIHSRIRLWSFDRYDSAAALVTPGFEAKRPLLGAVADGPAGDLPTTQAGITLSRPGVLVTAFGADPDGNEGTLLRVWEQSGVSGRLTVTLPKGMKASKATRVDLRGEPLGKPARIWFGRLTFDLHAYAPVSWVLE